MPTYPYACTACDNRFEIVQAFTDDALTVCDVCGGRLRKVFSSVGVVFKGSGFYRNDSRSTAGSTAGSGSSDSSSDTKTGAAAAGDGGTSSTPSTTAAPATPAKTETTKPSSTTAGKGTKESAA
ncbi:MAG: FmdB family transcriptional regulator [Rhodoferax sp.]|nr:FmdB family transcriptional regulator [Actinomycetota bacterium]